MPHHVFLVRTNRAAQNNNRIWFKNHPDFKHCNQLLVWFTLLYHSILAILEKWNIDQHTRSWMKGMFSDFEEKKVKMSRKIFLALAVVLCIQQVNCHMSNKFEPSDYVESDHTFANKRCKIIVLSLAGTWSTTGWGRPARARGRARTGQGRQCRQCPSEGNNLIFSASL